LTDASARRGELDLTASTLRWGGRLAADQTITLTYSDLNNDSVTGDAALDNTVASLTTSNCAAGSVDVNCRAVTQVLAESVQAPTASGPLAFTGGNVGRMLAMAAIALLGGGSLLAASSLWRRRSRLNG